MQWKRYKMFCYRSQAAVFLLILLGFTVHVAQAQQQVTLTRVDLNGTYYQERFGNSDDLAADTIRTPPGYDANPPTGQPGYAPGCFLKGVTITADYTIQNNTGRPLGVMIDVGLTNSDDGDTYWIRHYGVPNLLPYPDIHSVTLPALPDHIANLNLGFTFTFMVQDMYGAWQPAGQQVLQPIRLHTVLTQPQTPMGVPWDPVLEIACRWMRKTSTAENALRQLTKTMMGVLYDSSNKPYIEDWWAAWFYDPSRQVYTRFVRDPTTGAITGERFYLRVWLNASSNGWVQTTGQCDDVSNLWVILATAVGCAQVPQLINDPYNASDDFNFNPG